MEKEASGWPKWVGDDGDKSQSYVQDYLERKGIQLDPEEISDSLQFLI